MLRGDPVRLRQVLVNLLSNALKFTAQGEIVVRVQCGAESKRQLLFSVRDTGIGIPGDKQQKIFEDFTQVDRSTTRRYGGTGLGLAISSQLVHMMDGRIWVESEEGAGSTFFFSIDFEPATLSEDEVSTAPKSETDSAVPFVSLHILLAEDNRFNQVLACELLEKRGHTVSVANNGGEVLEALEEITCDLILMDVQMPIMDGFETTAAIRAREEESGGHVPIIGLTAHAMKGDRERCLEAGMDGYVPKPIQPDELFAVISELAGVSTAADAPVGETSAAAAVGFNRGELLERLEGDMELLGKMVELFFEDYPRYLVAIEAAIERSDAKALGQAAHGLKGPVATLSLNRALNQVLRLEDAGKRGDLQEAAAICQELRREIEQVRPHMLALGGDETFAN